ncbi:hypothetical protein SDC9_147175 [bioreactor metagenome]|uniref:Uncharacterized protein n=1 Tax=bioreactor metagenome TaxID=1076179 RepID=A0A645EDL8_9ZZZZ
MGLTSRVLSFDFERYFIINMLFSIEASIISFKNGEATVLSGFQKDKTDSKRFILFLASSGAIASNFLDAELMFASNGSDL